MPYRYLTFSTVILPTFLPVDPYDNGGFKPLYSPISGGGVWDHYGSAKPPRTERRISRKGRGVWATALDASHYLETLGYLAGSKDVLRRENESNTRVEWATARMLPEPEDRTPPQLYRYKNWWAADITLNFDILSKTWYGAHHGGTALKWHTGIMWGSGHTWHESSGASYPLSAGANSITLLQNGNTPTDNAIFVFTAGNAPITVIRWVGAGADMTWTGTLAATKSLVVDMGGQSVYNDGVKAYGGITRNVGHTVDGPLAGSIANGGSAYVITMTGGGTGSVFVPSYYDCWS